MNSNGIQQEKRQKRQIIGAGGANSAAYFIGGMAMPLFKGFSQIDLLERQPRTLCAILAEQLVLSNKAIEAQNEEIKQLRKKINNKE